MSRHTLIVNGPALALLAAGCAVAKPSFAPVSQTAVPVSAKTALVPPTIALSSPISRSPTGTPIPPTLAPTLVPRPPLNASGGGVLAFSSVRNGRPGIYVMNADGTDQRLVTDQDNASFPAFSPDGARLVYGTSAPYMGTISTINVDGTGRREAFARNRSMSDPDWSPDGRHIVFVFHTHQYFSIAVMATGGGNFRELTRPITNQINASPDWSPDGQRIVFSSDRSGDSEIFTMDANGDDVRQVTDNDVADYFPAWSPDGTRIVFASQRDGNWDVYLMDASGTRIRRLTDNPAKDWQPAWSPDGTRIAFASERDGNWEIYTMSVDGTQQHRVTDNEVQDTDPTWRPY